MNNYLIIEDWMYSYIEDMAKSRDFDYGKLHIFAYIYSFSKNDDGGEWFGKQQTLAEKCHLSEVTTTKKLKELVDSGAIIKTEEKVYGFVKRNKYKVNTERLIQYLSKLSLDVNKVQQEDKLDSTERPNLVQPPVELELTKYNTINNTINKLKYILHREESDSSKEESTSISSNGVYRYNSVYLAGRKKQNSRGPSRGATSSFAARGSTAKPCGAAASFGQSLPIDPVRSNMTF